MSVVASLEGVEAERRKILRTRTYARFRDVSTTKRMYLTRGGRALQ